MKLSAVRIFVWNVEEARDFYLKILELPLKSDGSENGYCVMDAGGAQLILEAVSPDAPEEDKALVGRFTGLSFATDNIHDKHRELLSRGVRFSGDPQLQFWGGWLATLQDPAGNEVQLVQLST